MRASLSIAAALTLDAKPLWLMFVGPPSCGKTEIYAPLASGYGGKKVRTSDVNIAGLISLERKHRGRGILARLGTRGLWTIMDFGSILGMRDEKRNELLGAMREVYDGRWQRDSGLGGEGWAGHINILACATPALERYHRVTASLGDRFLTIRVPRLSSHELWRKAAQQAGEAPKMRQELLEASQGVLRGISRPTASPEWLERMYACADFLTICRTPIHRDYGGNLVHVDEPEGPARAFQQIQAVALGDAAILGQAEVGPAQLPLISRVAFDSVPLHRGRILQALPSHGEPIKQHDLMELSDVGHHETFKRAIEELQAINVLEQRETPPNLTYCYKPPVAALLGAFLSHNVPPQ